MIRFRNTSCPYDNSARGNARLRSSRNVWASLVIGTAILGLPQGAVAAYVVGPPIVDGAGNIEHRLFLDGFHFGTLLELSGEAFAFRPHPDQTDPNGFGSTYRINPFLAGSDAGGPGSAALTDTAGGIDISLSGSVNPGVGTWTWTSTIMYDPVAQMVIGNGTMNVSLADTVANLGSDLNLYRIASNYLIDVPLQTGGIGDTGDMSRVDVSYGPGGDPRDFSWTPRDPDTFPTDRSSFLSVDVVGDTNVVDTLAQGKGFQIAIARKPSLLLSLSSTDSEALLSFGAVYDETESDNFAADNVGVVGLVLRGATSRTNMGFDVAFSSVPPPEGPIIPEPSTAIVFGALAAVTYAFRRWGGWRPT